MFKTIHDIPEKAAFLMVPPEYFRFTDPAIKPPPNDFARRGWDIYSADPIAFKKKAYAQWVELGSLLTGEMDACILEIEPIEGMGSQVFAADPSLTLTNDNGYCTTLLSRFSNERRSREVATHQQFFETTFPKQHLVMADFNIEGTGDNIYDPYRKLFWSGFTDNPGADSAAGRSDIRSHTLLSEQFETPVISLNVARPFFHIDTALAPLSGGHILFHEEGIHPDYRESFLEAAFDKYGLPREEFLIPVDADDAKHFACNVVCQDKTVIMPSCSEALQATLKAKGYTVWTVDVSIFILGGGGPHCLVNNIKAGL